MAVQKSLFKTGTNIANMSLGGLGAIGGAAAGGTLAGVVPYGMNGGEGAMVGAVAGGLAGGLALPAMTAVGSAAMFMGKKAFTANPNKPPVDRPPVFISRDNRETGLRNFTKQAATQPIKRYGDFAGRVAGSFVKYTPEETVFDKENNKIVTKRGKLRPTGKGVFALGAIAATMGAKNVGEDLYDRQGAPTGTRRATPNYLDSAGATGDLVFAMHQNRRG